MPDLWRGVFGGYSSTDDSGMHYLLPDLPELEGVPDRSNRERTYRRYKVFWPTGRGPIRREPWTADGGNLTFRFAAWHLNAFAGSLETGAADRSPNGWLYTIKAANTDPAILEQVPGLPTRCPNCGDDREMRAVRRGGQIAASARHESGPDADAAVADARQRRTGVADTR